MDVHQMTNKKTRLELLETLPKDAYGAELGVFEGTFARDIIRVTRPRWIWLVDLFEGPVTSGDQDGCNLRTVEMSSMGIRLAEEFANKPVRVVKSRSVDWLNGVQESALDFVYIDTDHTLTTTVLELEAARRAVRDGGIIAGHDFSPHFGGVVRAVMSFVTMHGLQDGLEIFGGDGLPSYRIENRKAGNRESGKPPSGGAIAPDGAGRQGSPSPRPSPPERGRSPSCGTAWEEMVKLTEESNDGNTI
jgi:hypothetical protein